MHHYYIDSNYHRYRLIASPKVCFLLLKMSQCLSFTSFRRVMALEQKATLPSLPQKVQKLTVHSKWFPSLVPLPFRIHNVKICQLSMKYFCISTSNHPIKENCVLLRKLYECLIIIDFLRFTVSMKTVSIFIVDMILKVMLNIIDVDDHSPVLVLNSLLSVISSDKQ